MHGAESTGAPVTAGSSRGPEGARRTPLPGPRTSGREAILATLEGVSELPGATIDPARRVPVLHLDARLVVVDKPAGLLVHRTRKGADEDALLQRVRDQLGRRVYPVHRLDRPTSGAVAFGLDPAATAALKAAFEAQDGLKHYLALARGLVAAPFERDDPLEDEEGVARSAWTAFEPIAWLAAGRCTLVRARLHQGRWHQVRRHLARAGHPIVGDRRHGKTRTARVAQARFGLRRLALHAAGFEVAHPDGGRLDVRAPLPPDLRAVLAALGRPDLDP